MNNILKALTDYRVTSLQADTITLEYNTYDKYGKLYRVLPIQYTGDMFRAVVLALSKEIDDVVADDDIKDDIIDIAGRVGEVYTDDIYTLFVVIKFMKTLHYGKVKFDNDSIEFISFTNSLFVSDYDASVLDKLRASNIQFDKFYSISTFYNAIAKYIRNGSAIRMIPNKTNK